jgi:hypothetical protein
MGQGRPLHSITDRALAIGAVVTPMRGCALGGCIGCFLALDAIMTRNPAVFDTDSLPTELSFALERPACEPLSGTFIVVA